MCYNDFTKEQFGFSRFFEGRKPLSHCGDISPFRGAKKLLASPEMHPRLGFAEAWAARCRESEIPHRLVAAARRRSAATAIRQTADGSIED